MEVVENQVIELNSIAHYKFKTTLGS